MKYYIITYGCQMNISDSEKIAYKLEKEGYQLAKNMEQADLVIINVCSVRQSAVDRVYGKVRLLNKLKQKNPKLKIILTGCILESDKKKLENQIDGILPIISLSKPAKYHSLTKAYVPIMTGCNNFCTYCVVPYTRGREISRKTDEVLCEIKKLVRKGYDEITLLGQNVNSYKSYIKEDGQIKKVNFSRLLKMINNISGNFKIYFLTNHPKDMSDELIKTIAQCEKVVKKIHLPFQAGDNKILRKMNRGYTIEHYKDLVKKIYKIIPNAEISTDIIVGFPGETREQFEKTVQVMKEIKFSQAYIARYSPRPGTPAFKMKDNVSMKEKIRRRDILMEIIHPKRAER